MFISPFHTKNFETKFLYMPSKILTTPQSSVGVPANYYSLQQANPYRGLTYKKSPWQNFLSKLGFRTEADAWQENMQLQAQEYDSALQAKIYDEQYNDPSSQVQRMKAAGLNPDLDPSTINSNQASPFGEDPSVPMQTSSDNPEGMVMQFANGLMSILSTSIGMVESFQGLERNRLQNQILSTDSDSAMTDLVEKVFPRLLPGEGLLGEMDDTGETWQGQVLQQAEFFAQKALSPKQRKKFLGTIESLYGGALSEAESYEQFSRNIRARAGYEVDSHTYLDEAGDISDIIVSELSELSKELLTLRPKAEKAGLESQIEESEYNAEFYKDLDPEIAAKAENEANKFSERNIRMSDTLNKHLDNIIEKIQKTSEESGVKGGLASIALSMLAVFRLVMVSNMLPSVSHSSSQGAWMTDRGQGSNMGSSFSIGW